MNLWTSTADIAGPKNGNLENSGNMIDYDSIVCFLNVWEKGKGETTAKLANKQLFPWTL
jgi:hypothetical protein